MLSFEFPEDGAAIVIGGTGGIGRSICARLAEAGSNVAFTYRKSADVAKEVEEAVRGAGRRTSSSTVDVTDAAGVQACFDRFRAEFGKIHSVVYTSSLEIPQPWISHIGPDLLQRALHVNVMGLFDVV